MDKNYMLVNYLHSENSLDLKEFILNTARQYGLLVHLRDAGEIEPKLENYLWKDTRDYVRQEAELTRNLESAKEKLKAYKKYTFEDKQKILNQELQEMYQLRDRYYARQAQQLSQVQAFKDKFLLWNCPHELNFIYKGVQQAIRTAEEEFSKEYHSESYIKQLEKTEPEDFYQKEIKAIIDSISYLKEQIKENKRDMEQDHRNEDIIKLFESLERL